MYRHGDVLIIPINEMPQNVQATTSRVLAEGEATGHAHRLLGEGTLYLTANGELILRNDKPVAVVHEEHARIELPPGTYEVRRQKEYQPGAVPQNVRD